MWTLRKCALVIPAMMLAGCDADTLPTGSTAEPAIAMSVMESFLTCGASVSTDVKLGNDLVCTNPSAAALIVTADNITIDLNGHSITGPGSGTMTLRGIQIQNRRNVTVRGGTIRGFETGIFVARSFDVTIEENHLTQNQEAIFLNGTSDSVVKENHAWDNRLRGIMLRPAAGTTPAPSTGNLVAENVLSGNPSGILVFAQSGNTIRENWISGSSTAALDLVSNAGAGGTGNVIKENVLRLSAVGILFGVAWTGNSFKENQLLQNACGISGTSAGNSLLENLFSGNVSDFC